MGSVDSVKKPPTARALATACGLLRGLAVRQLLERRPPAVARQVDIDEELSAPRRARLFVKTACQDWQLDTACDDAVLVASELVGNAVVHARTSCSLSIRLMRSA